MLEQEESVFDEETLLYPRTWFWLMHIAGMLAVFWIGFKVGKRRYSAFPGIVFQVLRMLSTRQ